MRKVSKTITFSYSSYIFYMHNLYFVFLDKSIFILFFILPCSPLFLTSSHLTFPFFFSLSFESLSPQKPFYMPSISITLPPP